MKSLLAFSLILIIFSTITHAQTENEYTDRNEMVLSGNGQVIAIRGRYLPDENLFEGGVYPIDFFNAQTGELIKTIDDIIPSAKGIGLNYDGTLFSYYTNFGNADVVDIQTEEQVMALQIGGAAEAGPTNWSRGNNNLVATFGISASQVFDVNLQKKIVTNIYPINEINYSIAVSISNDGTLLAESMGTETTAYLSIWDIPAPYEFAPPKLFLENIGSRSISWKNDNTQIVSNARGHVDIADVTTGNITKLYLANPDEVIQAVSWSPDGTKIAGGSRNNMVWIWDVATGQIVGNYPTEFAVTSVAWSPDSQRLYHTGGSEGVYINGLPMADYIAQENSATATPTPTPIPPTATFTPTPIPPSPTPTATSVACTHTVVASSTSSLISAIVSANSASTPSTICLGGGTYTLTAVNNSDESPNGLPSITKNITIIGNNSVIERAASAPQFRIFRVATNGRLSLNNLTVRGGHAGSLSGGGVRNLGILELNTVIVENNTGNAGGGIRNNNNATFTAINSLIRNNISTTNGGGLYANNGSSTTLTNTNFLGNTTNSTNGLGGAIFSNGNVFSMSGGIIQNNSARNGGGIFVNITTQAMSLSNVQFTGNIASNHGAGIYHLSGTTFSVQNGRFTSNIATNEGGAIAGDGTFTITNSNFISNSANIGGAIHAQATSGSSIQQSCLENNTAPNTIGIFNEASVILNAQNNFWGSVGASGSVSANVNTNGALTACGNG